MKRIAFAVAGAGLAISAAAYAENVRYHAGIQTVVGITDASKVALKPAPIPKDWVIEGDPDTRGAEIAHTDDNSTQVFVWQTTASRFMWHYDADEVVIVLDGEVFLTDQSKTERRLGPGGVAFFPEGSTVHWRVPDHVRKIATLKHVLPEPVAGVIRLMRLAKNLIKPMDAEASGLGK